MFITITAQVVDDTRLLNTIVSEANDLYNLLDIYEKSPKVKAYRVLLDDGRIVTNFTTDFGWANIYHSKNNTTFWDWT